LVDKLPSGLDVSFRSPIVVSFLSSKKDRSSMVIHCHLQLLLFTSSY
jgi:hypothetical protein